MKKRDGNDIDEFGLHGRPVEDEHGPDGEKIKPKPSSGQYLSWEDIAKLAGEPGGDGFMTAIDKTKLDMKPSKRVPKSSVATMSVHCESKTKL